MGSSTDRARKALDAMKLLGFSRKQAAPVLKQLLRAFNNNWEPIEDECYRALADAILDAQDQETNQTPASQLSYQGLGTQGTPDESVPHCTTRNDPHHSASASQYDMDEDDSERPLVKRPRMGAADFRQEPQPFSIGCKSLEPGPQQSSFPIQGAVLASPETNRRQTNKSLILAQKAADRGDPSGIIDALILKEPKPEPEIDVEQGTTGHTFNRRDVLAGSDAIQLSAGSSGGKSMMIEHHKTRKMASAAGARGGIIDQAKNLDNSLLAVPVCKNGVGSTVQNTQESSFVELDVAASTNCEVKMSLKCNFDPSKLCISMEEVFKMVQEKCLHSYKVQLPPELSIGKLMNEVCQSVAQLGAMHSEVHSNSISMQNEADAPFVMPIACKTAVDDLAAGGSSVPEPSEPFLQNSIVAWEPESALCEQKTIHDVADISKGEERVRISVINEFGTETCPPSFYYIPRNLVFQNAYVNISIARIGDEDYCADCSGNCLSASLPCACARATGGEFAYTPEGLVRTTFLDECILVNHFPEKHHRFYCKACPVERSKNETSPGPCKGHLVKKIIKECWSKCGCGMQCGNRVIQRGITCKLQVFFTREGKGWGLRTLEDLPKGAFVCEYAGEVLTTAELYERTVENARNGKHMHQVLLDADWGSEGALKDEETLSLDATFYGNVGRFINHRCYDANLVQIPVEVETPDHHYYHVALFTTKKVEAFEELTWDYGIDFDDADYPVKAFRCMCGSRYCRDPKNSRRAGKGADGGTRGGL